jgi:hypothetical protein
MRSPNVVAAVLLLGALAGCQDPEVPSRAQPYEFRLSPADPVFRWPSDDLPVRFWVEPSGALPEYVTTGMVSWARQFLYGEFWGELVSDSLAADILVSYLDEAPPDAPLTDDPPQQVCTGTTTIPLPQRDVEGRLRFPEPITISVRWFSADPTDIANCLQRVVAHEIGHALGIFAHSPNAGDLMAIPVVAREPSRSDRSTAQLLYHSVSDILPYRP